MGDLLTRVTNFFNFQKTFNVSVPGLMVAGAIVLISTSGHTPMFPAPKIVLDQQTLDELKIPGACARLSADWRAQGGTTGRLSERDWTTLEERHGWIEDCTYQLQQRVVNEQNKIARLALQIDADQKLFTSFSKKYEDEQLAASPLAAGSHTLAQAHLKQLTEARALTKNAENLAAIYNSILTRLADENKAILKVLHAGDQEEPWADLMARLINGVMYFVLFGIVCGLIVDPVMGGLQAALYTDDRLLKLNAAEGGVQVLPKEITVDGEIVRVNAYNVNYALGLGIITEADIEALRRRYLYRGQLLLNLAVAGPTLLVAVGLYVDTHLDLFKRLLETP